MKLQTSAGEGQMLVEPVVVALDMSALTAREVLGAELGAAEEPPDSARGSAIRPGHRPQQPRRPSRRVSLNQLIVQTDDRHGRPGISLPPRSAEELAIDAA
jgi:hypothetical protein